MRVLLASVCSSLLACSSGSTATAPEVDPLWFRTLEAEHWETLQGGPQLSYPVDLTVDEDGIWVADTSNDRVVVFDHSFADPRVIGRPGSGPGEFEAPSAVRTTDDELYTSDLGNARISRFEKSGAYVDEARFPNGLASFAVTPSGALLLPGSEGGAAVFEWDDGAWRPFMEWPEGMAREVPPNPDFHLVAASDGAIWMYDIASGRFWRFDDEGSLTGAGELPAPLAARLEAYRGGTVEGLANAGVRVLMVPLTKGISDAGSGRVLIHLLLRDVFALLVSPDGDGFAFQEVRVQEGLLGAGVLWGSRAIRLWRDKLYVLSDQGIFVFGQR